MKCVINGTTRHAALLAGITLATVIGFESAAIAQDMQAINDGAVAVEAQAEAIDGAERVLPEGMDSFSANDVLALDQADLIEVQKDIGADILILDRDAARAQKIQALVQLLGPEAFRKTYPELATLLEDSPIFLNADLAKQEIINKIKTAEIELEQVSSPKVSEGAKTENGLQVRDDGSAYFDPPSIAGGEPPAVPDYLASYIAQELQKYQAEAERQAAETAAQTVDEEGSQRSQIAMSVREIYGLAGSGYTAVVTFGDERIRIHPGDELPYGIRIDSIDEDTVHYTRDGQSRHLILRN